MKPMLVMLMNYLKKSLQIIHLLIQLKEKRNFVQLIKGTLFGLHFLNSKKLKCGILISGSVKRFLRRGDTFTPTTVILIVLSIFTKGFLHSVA